MVQQVTRRSRLGPMAAAVVALVLLVGGCADSPTGEDPESSSAAGEATSGGGGQETASSAEDTDSGGDSGGGSGGGTDPNGPDLQLFTLPECQVIPGGALSGADVLTMCVAVRNGGPGEFTGLAPASISSDTGLQATLNSGISTGSSFTAMQVDLSSGDYNRTHRFTITVDPDGQTAERDESNNDLQITVPLPARPSGAIDVACTSP